MAQNKQARYVPCELVYWGREFPYHAKHAHPFLYPSPSKAGNNNITLTKPLGKVHPVK